MAWVKAACLEQIAAGECKGVSLGGAEIALFNVDGHIHATANICTHQLAYLSEGYLEGEWIECPLHQGRFNVTTGEAEGPPVSVPLKVFPIKIENGDILLDLGDPTGGA